MSEFCQLCGAAVGALDFCPECGAHHVRPNHVHYSVKRSPLDRASVKLPSLRTVLLLLLLPVAAILAGRIVMSAASGSSSAAVADVEHQTADTLAEAHDSSTSLEADAAAERDRIAGGQRSPGQISQGKSRHTRRHHKSARKLAGLSPKADPSL